jgi:uncharacterized protein (UPF0332 family)
MAFQWADFLTVATSLRSAGDDASLRAAVSRAYYAVFGETREFLELERGRPFPDDSVHKAVSDCLDASGVAARQVFGSNLRQLKTQRVRADYKANQLVDTRYTDKALADAGQLLTDLTAIQAARSSTP